MRTIALSALAIVAAGALACGGDRGATPPASATMADTAEQVMYGVQHVMVELGVKKAQLNSDSAFIFDRHNRFELRGQVRMMLLDSVGQPAATMTASEATYNMRRKTMEARGAIVVTTPDGKRLDATQLSYDQQQNTISTSASFRLVEPNRLVVGDSMITDPKLERQKCYGCQITNTGNPTGGGGNQ